MKILFAVGDYLSHSNGTSISAQRYAACLRSFGHEVRIITYAEPPYPNNIYALKKMGVPGFNSIIESNGFLFAKPDRRVFREAIAWCDILHTYTAFPMECFVKKMALKMGKPVTTAFHVQAENISSNLGVGKVEAANRFLYRLHYNTMYHNVRFIHCPSQMMADELRHYGYKNEDIRVISNGISDDFQYYRPADEGTYASDKIVISMVGRLSPEKRQDLLIKAAGLSRYRDRIQLQFAGTGISEQEYRKLGEKLPNQPVFGYYTRQELIELLHRTHLYVHASDMESEAIGCIEAFATGLVPIIADSPLSATKQFALDERSLFRAGDPQSLADRIDWWIEHPEERKEMEIRYAHEAQNYRLEKCVRQFEQMLYDAIEYYRTVATASQKKKKTAIA